jgi:glycosyltransferase involved in cell wall biosynthesis
VGGIPEVVDHNVNGLLVPSGEPADLALAVESLIRDPEHRETLGRAAQKKARTVFSADHIVSRYEAYYRAVIGG